MKSGYPRIEKCPGLGRAESGVVTFTDSLGRVYDLERERTLRPKEAAADDRMSGLSPWAVRSMVARGELYPVMRKNRRVIMIFDCALTEWRSRGLRKVVTPRKRFRAWAHVPGVIYLPEGSSE
jgi:hypothetical protein